MTNRCNQRFYSFFTSTHSQIITKNRLTERLHTEGLSLLLFALVLDCNHDLQRKTRVSRVQRDFRASSHLICDVNQEQSAGEDGILINVLKKLLQRRAELLRIFDELLLALFDCLLAGRARDEAEDFVDRVEQLLNGTCDFSARRNIESDSISSG